MATNQKQQNNQPTTFWGKVLKSGGGISSKRLMGCICIFFAMAFAVAGLMLGVVGEVDGIVSTVVIEFLTAGVALFGVTAWEKRKTPDNYNNNYNYGDNYNDNEYNQNNYNYHKTPKTKSSNEDDEDYLDEE